jgi:hypothetical protein
MAQLDLLGLAEVAELLDVEPSRIGRWRRLGVVLQDGQRVPFPAPVHEVRATPLWHGDDLRPLVGRIVKRPPPP